MFAASECIQTTVMTNFTRCSATIASGYPTMNVEIPDPVRIQFNISASGGAPGTTQSARTLTPTNGAASFAPFKLTFTRFRGPGGEVPGRSPPLKARRTPQFIKNL